MMSYKNSLRLGGVYLIYNLQHMLPKKTVYKHIGNSINGENYREKGYW